MALTLRDCPKKKNSNHQTFRDNSCGFRKRSTNFKRKSRGTGETVQSQDRQNNQKDQEKETRGKHSLKSALIRFDHARQEKIKAKEQMEKRRQEMKIALERYKQKKKNRNKKLLPRTSKGQPIMKNRIEMLLEKIQSSI